MIDDSGHGRDCGDKDEWQIMSGDSYDVPAPELDPEAVFLCSLVYSGDRGEVAALTGHLAGTDFLNPSYAAIYATVGELAQAGLPHEPSRILAVLLDNGQLAGAVGERIRFALTTVVTLGIPSLALRSLARDVLAASYRRRFAQAVAVQQFAADNAPTDALFGLMCEQGRIMREQTQRLDNLTKEVQ